MSPEQAQAIAHEWIDSWNSRDLSRVLSHCTDDLESSSPFVVEVAGEPSGTLYGKQAVARYWAAALARNPDLHFELRGDKNLLIVAWKWERSRSMQGALSMLPSATPTAAHGHCRKCLGSLNTRDVFSVISLCGPFQPRLTGSSGQTKKPLPIAER
jgi:SnoaL-like domain